MSGKTTNFEDWRLRSHLKIWELASIIHGFDPRALADVTVNNSGDSLDLSFEIYVLTSAVNIGDLVPLPGQGSIDKNTQVSLPSAIDWLRARGHKRIARQLSTTIHPNDAPISKKNDIVKRLRHAWKEVDEDIKRAQVNGLSEEAAAPRSGYWYEGSIIEWGIKNGKLRDPAVDGAVTLTNAWFTRSKKP